MTKKQKAAYVIEALEGLYPETPIPLDHYSPFTLLCAVGGAAGILGERTVALKFTRMLAF